MPKSISSDDGSNAAATHFSNAEHALHPNELECSMVPSLRAFEHLVILRAFTKIYGMPGLGTFFVTSIQNRDYTTIMGVTVFYSALLVSLNLLVDICYGFIDPRIKLGG